MRAFFKVILLIITFGMGLLCLFFVVDEVYRGIMDRGKLFEDESLIFPLIFVIISVPSIMFHLESLKLYRSKSISSLDNDTLDEGLAHNSHEYHKRISINLVLWFGNLIFGLSILSLGVLLFIILQESFPITEFPNGFTRYLLLTGIVIMGVWILVDLWRVKIRINRVK